MTEPASLHPSPDPADEERRWTSPVIGVGISSFSRTPRVRFLARLAELAVGTGFVLVMRSPGAPKYTAGLVAAVVAGLAWLAWILSSFDRRRTMAALLILAAAGGVCAAAHRNGLLFVFVATAATAYSFSSPIAIVVFAPAAVGYFVTELAADTLPGDPASLVSVALLGLILGFARRQLHERGREATLLATAERRVELAEREAQLAGERNRLGREIHDVLAHTLGAVSIQLTALDARLDSGDSPEALRVRVSGLRDLVGDGLQEARNAVRALRDERLALETQVERLCDLHSATLRVEGNSGPLRADEALALYRVVQESLTNAAKHAPEGSVAVTLAYGDAKVTVTVHNDPGGEPGPLAGSGGGNGLAGMRTRVELAGGTCTAGPDDDGWTVTASLPRD